ncbi:MAG: response regulator [Acidobacteria bacterium]|nr:response regulator [Acidobacteriota bacterium]
MKPSKPLSLDLLFTRHVVWDADGQVLGWGAGWGLSQDQAKFEVNPPIQNSYFLFGPRVVQVTATVTGDQTEGWLIQEVVGGAISFLGFEKSKEQIRSKQAHDVINNLSHELRTPIHGIIGISDVLGQSDLPEGLVKLNQMIQSSAHKLSGTVDSLIHFLALEQGAIQWEPVPVELTNMLEDILDMHAQKAQERGVELGAVIPEEAQIRVLADPRLIGHILGEMIENALKFTDKGTVSVFVIPHEPKETSQEIRFEVRDTGLGIQRGQEELIFRPFYQASHGLSRTKEGTGLGLYIVRLMAEHLGGKIWAEPQTVGSTVVFEVPFMRAETKGVNSNVHPLAGFRGLYVDDNRTARFLVELILRAQGVSIEVCESGHEALSRLQASLDAKKPFDFMIVDYQLEDLNGLELSKRIAQSESLHALPRIMLTAHPKKAVGDWEASGFSDFITKPFRRSRFIKTVYASLARTKEWILSQYPSAQPFRIVSFETEPIDIAIEQHLAQHLGFELNFREDFSGLSDCECDVLLVPLEKLPENFRALGPDRCNWVGVLPSERPHALENLGLDFLLSKPLKILDFHQLYRLFGPEP